MKKKYQIKSILAVSSFCLALVLLSLVLFLSPAAQTALAQQGTGGLGDQCGPDTCRAGFTCDTTSSTCLLPTGASCAATRFCVMGSSCVGNVCVADSQNSNLCANVVCNPGVTCNPADGRCPNPSSTGTRRTGGTGGVAGSAECGGDPNLSYQNGVCLPVDQACTTGFCASDNLTDLLYNIIQFLLGLAGAIAVLVLIVGGFWYITSGGNEEQAEKGKKAIINALIGVVVIVLSYAIVTIIYNTLK